MKGVCIRLSAQSQPCLGNWIRLTDIQGREYLLNFPLVIRLRGSMLSGEFADSFQHGPNRAFYFAE